MSVGRDRVANSEFRDGHGLAVFGGGRGLVFVARAHLRWPREPALPVPTCVRTNPQLALHNDSLRRSSGRGDCLAVALGGNELDLAQLNTLILPGNENRRARSCRFGKS